MPNDTVVFKRLLKGSLTASQYYTKLSEIYTESISNPGNLYFIESYTSENGSGGIGDPVIMIGGVVVTDYTYTRLSSILYTDNPSVYSFVINARDTPTAEPEPFLQLMLETCAIKSFNFQFPFTGDIIDDEVVTFRMTLASSTSTSCIYKGQETSRLGSLINLTINVTKGSGISAEITWDSNQV